MTVAGFAVAMRIIDRCGKACLFSESRATTSAITGLNQRSIRRWCQKFERIGILTALDDQSGGFGPDGRGRSNQYRVNFLPELLESYEARCKQAKRERSLSSPTSGANDAFVPDSGVPSFRSRPPQMGVSDVSLGTRAAYAAGSTRRAIPAATATRERRDRIRDGFVTPCDSRGGFARRLFRAARIRGLATPCGSSDCICACGAT